MLEFKKYNSIENSYDRDFMEKVMLQMPSDLQYVVQEKVHGANTSFVCDGTDVKLAKRTAMLADDENFYEFQPLLEAYKPKVLHLFNYIKESHPNVVRISVFGELFGGFYPHDAVKQQRNLTKIQKGVCYTPNHEFYGFDILLFGEEDSCYLPVDEVNAIFEHEGFFYAKTLFQGTLEECLNYPNAFQSKIAEWLGLPAIDDNICEGVVIRPVTPMYLRNGSRVLIKNKNERFSEKKSAKVRNKLFTEPVPHSDALNGIITELESYITVNRLNNVISHIGQVSFPKDFGMVMGQLSRDVFEDFMKEHHGNFEALDKCEQKNFKRELNKLCTTLVRKTVMNGGE